MKIAIVSADRSDANGSPWNLGDAFLTDVLLTELAHRGHEARAIDFGWMRTHGSLPRVPGDGLHGLASFARWADLVIVGGGTLFQDDNRDALLGGLPRLCLAASVCAAVARKPVVYFAVGCDPMPRPVHRWALRAATRGRRAWVRDHASRTRARDQFHLSARVAADACLLPAADVLLSDLHPPERSAQPHVFALNRREMPLLGADIVRESNRSTGSPAVLLSMSQGAGHSDIAGPDLLRLAGEGAVDAGYPLSWRDAARHIVGAEAVVASRMHALYIALLLDKPMVAIGGSPKITQFATEFGIPQVRRLLPDTPTIAARADAAAVRAARRRVSSALTEVEEVYGC